MDILWDADLAAPRRRPEGAVFLLAGLAVTLLLLLGTLATALEYRHTVDARAKLVLSYQRRIVVTDLLSRLVDAETAERGYLITGDPAFLAPYAPAIAAIARQRHALEARLIAVPRQSARYAELGEAIDSRIAALNEVLAVSPPGRRSPPRVRNHDEGREAMNRARRIATAMTAEEDSMIATRGMLDDHRVAVVQNVLALLLTILAVLSGLWLTREWRARRSRFQLEGEAQAAEARLRGVFAATSDAVALIGPDGAIEAVNPAVVQLVGRASDALVGRDISALVDAMPAAGAFVDRLGLVDGRLGEAFRIDRVAHHVDGHDVPVDVALGLMPVPSGLHVVAAIRDISERKRLDRMKDEFVATVSHELRTPLTSIVGALGLLRATPGGTSPDVARRLVQVAEDNSQRLIDLVDDLLDIEKMEAAGLRFQERPLDLAVVLAEVAHRSEALAAVRDVRIALVVAPGGMPVRGDGGRLAQVATNLLANAVRFSPRGQTVTMTAVRDRGRAVVTVDDTGPGVPEAFRDQLFTRFAQSEAGAGAGRGTGTAGTGLGLAISHQIVRAHGGTIWFEPRPGGGARFGFAIDLSDRGADAPHLLICAQDAAVACGLRAVADAGACSADRVATVSDARAAIASGTYDAVLADLDTDDLPGAALLAALTAEACDGQLPVPVIARQAGTIWLGAMSDRETWDGIDPEGGALAAGIRALPDRIDRSQPLIVHVDRDASVIDRTAAALRRRARLWQAADPPAAAAMLDRERPSLLILDHHRTVDATTALLLRAAEGPGHPIATILYSARIVPLALEAMVDCVVTRSSRSSPNLIAAVDRLLARTRVETAAGNAARAGKEDVFSAADGVARPDMGRSA